MNQRFFVNIQQVLSPERLSAYGQDHPGSCVVLARYLWNAALCESLYSPLQMCEVALRNAIHYTMCQLYGDAWYDRIELRDIGKQQLAAAKKNISNARRPIVPCRVVAELPFGFWTSMFEDHYERNTQFLPGGIRNVLPKMPKPLHKRKFIKDRLNKIRYLRNRVFHHERIVHWKDLQEQHSRLIETIGWISPELCDVALKLDRFLETYTHGIGPWIVSIRNHWPATLSTQPTGTASADLNTP